MVFPGSHLLGPSHPFHTDSYTFWPWPSQLSLNFERIGNAKFSSWVARRPLGYYKGQKWIEKEKYSWVVGKREDQVDRLLLFPVTDLVPVKSDTALSILILEFSLPQVKWQPQGCSHFPNFSGFISRSLSSEWPCFFSLSHGNNYLLFIYMFFPSNSFRYLL